MLRRSLRTSADAVQSFTEGAIWPLAGESLVEIPMHIERGEQRWKGGSRLILFSVAWNWQRIDTAHQ